MDLSHKETERALLWFRENLYLKNDVLIWGESVGTTRRRSTAYLNKPAGTVSPRGYIQVRMGKDKFMAHRIIWAMHHNSWPSGVIDHINGDKLDNRLCNLRDTDQLHNCKNASKYNRGQNLPTGVHLDKSGRYRAQIQIDGKKMYLGAFGNSKSAHYAYLSEKANHNFTGRHGI